MLQSDRTTPAVSRTPATTREHGVPGVARRRRRSEHWCRNRCGCRRKLRWRRGSKLCRRHTTELLRLVCHWRGCSWLSSILGRHARHAPEDPIAISRPLIDRAHLWSMSGKLACRCCRLCRQWRTSRRSAAIRAAERPQDNGEPPPPTRARWARALSTTRQAKFWPDKAAHAPVEALPLP